MQGAIINGRGQNVTSRLTPLSLQVDNKYRGDHRRVVNLVRASGVFDDLVDIRQALETLLREHGDLQLVRVKGAPH